MQKPINILVTILQLIFVTTLFGQSKKTSQIQLKHADQMDYNIKVASDARRFIGNVWLQHDDIDMYCDSVYLYSETNNIKAFSRVRLVKGDSLEVFSDYLFYHGNIKQSQFRKNVVMKDKSVTLLTDSLNYDIGENKAYYFEKGKIIDSTAVLTSKTGYYNINEKHLFFNKDVVVDNKEYIVYTDTLKYDLNTNSILFEGPTTIENDSSNLYSERGKYNTKSKKALIWQEAKYTTTEQIMWADTIFYDHNLNFGEGFKNIEIHSIKDSLILTSDYAFHDRTQMTTLLTQKALVMQVSNADTLYLHSDTIFARIDSVGTETFRRISMYHKAQLWGKQIQMRADSIVFSLKDSIVRLFRAPVIWADSIQLTADNIHLKIIDGDFREMHLLDNALMVIQHNDSLYYDQIKGQTIIGYLKNKTLNKVYIDRRSEVIYYVIKDGEISSMNFSRSLNISVFFEDGQIDQVVFLTQPDGKVHPLSKLNKSNMYFRNFVWYENVRPKKLDDVFIWTNLPPRPR